ncbi:MAG: amidohydrolase [Planctomycetota bacterium]
MLWLLLAASLAHADPADLVIENARIWSDGRAGFAEFAAVRDGRFVHVGTADEKLIGPSTQRIDAGGRLVVPGLFDSHIHLLSGGGQLSKLYLRDATSKEGFIRRVADWAADLEPGEWILGGRWSTESWADRKWPTKAWVDRASGDHPLFLSRMDGHSAIVNSAALAMAGISGLGPPDPEGGVIDRDPATAEPTGILRDGAMNLVSRLIPDPTIEDHVRWMRRAMAHAVAHGITAASDIPDLEDLPVYERLIASGDLPMRLFLFPTAGDWRAATERVARFKGRTAWLEVKGLKAYMDGSLGSRTAYMHEPFLGNDPGRESWRGLLREGVDEGRFAGNVAAASDAGLQTIVHAIGDEANRLLLDTLAATYGDLASARCRGEHAQHLLPQDIARFGRLGVIASMQPYHKADDGRYAEDYIGSVRARSSYAYTSLLNAGAALVFGSDWPVVTLDPFLGIEAAVTGRTLDGKLWQTQENITVAEALRCYTSTAAYAVFAEDELGRIAPGYRADFVILNGSLFGLDVDWSSIAPIAVYVEGRRVFAGED